MPMLETALVARVRGREHKLAAWFRESGEDLLVLLHGLGNSKDVWRGAWETPALRGRSLLAFDLPGFGHTPPLPGLPFGLEDHAGILAAAVDAYALRDIHIVAHSMGGSIALLLPDRILARLRSLALLEPRLCRSSCGLATEIAAGGFEQFTGTVLPRMRQRHAHDAQVLLDIDRADPSAFYAAACSLARWTESRELLRRFETVPVRKRLIYGQRNRHLEELRVLDKAHQIEIPGAGHFAMNDNPKAFYARIAALVPSTAGL